MDTKTLTVGQIITLGSGIYGTEGKVAKIMPWGGVEVQLIRSNGFLSDELAYFDTDGKACDINGNSYLGVRFDIRYMPGTYECGLWEIVDSTGWLKHQAAP